MNYMNKQLTIDANALRDEASRINAKFSKKEFSSADYREVSHKLTDLKTRIDEFSGNFNAGSKQQGNAEGLALVKGLNGLCFSIEKNLDEHFEPDDHY